jgi:hypothetical protein
MLAASMAVGHLLTATEREPPRPPHRHQARGTSPSAVFDGGVAYPEEVGGLALFHTSPYGFD